MKTSYAEESEGLRDGGGLDPARCLPHNQVQPCLSAEGFVRREVQGTFLSNSKVFLPPPGSRVTRADAVRTSAAGKRFASPSVRRHDPLSSSVEGRRTVHPSLEMTMKSLPKKANLPDISCSESTRSFLSFVKFRELGICHPGWPMQAQRQMDWNMTHRICRHQVATTGAGRLARPTTGRWLGCCVRCWGEGRSRWGEGKTLGAHPRRASTPPFPPYSRPHDLHSLPIEVQRDGTSSAEVPLDSATSSFANDLILSGPASALRTAHLIRPRALLFRSDGGECGRQTQAGTPQASFRCLLFPSA